MFIISKFTVKTANADTETTLKATDSDLRLQRLHSSPTTPAQRHHFTVDISVQANLNCSTRPIRFYPNVIVALTVTDWTKHLAVET